VVVVGADLHLTELAAGSRDLTVVEIQAGHAQFGREFIRPVREQRAGV
jgi:hypothetical protein